MSDVAVEIDLSHAQFGREIPFGAFAQLRKHAPVFWYEPDQYWVISTYDLVGEVNRNPTVFSSWAGPSGAGTVDGPADAPAGDRTILTMDPPKHTAYRRLVSSSFMPRAVKAREPMVRSLARELVDEFVAGGGGDWVRDVATLLPFRVMAELMGISRADEEAILHRVDIQMSGAQGAAEESDRYADRLLDEHRREPRGDLVDQLLDARIDGHPLTQEELRAWIGVYIGGGAETTKHLIAHGLVSLLERPEVRAEVVAGCDSALLVEEMLRFCPPVMHHSRWPLQTIEVGGQVIEAGQRTTLWMVSANRDENEFPDPDRFDVGRNPNRHDSLGAGGPHFCLGAGLARLEARVLFEELRTYLGRMELAGEPVRGPNNFFNLMTTCAVEVH
jgi:cholest-4-en-3-one 26-monooxygenase